MHRSENLKPYNETVSFIGTNVKDNEKILTPE
jgi:hypothetical protein